MSEQIQNWNVLWRKNENKMLGFGPSLRHKIRLVLGVMRRHGLLKREISLVDIACGSGVFLSRIQSKIGTVAGVDSSSVALEMAHERVPQARYRVLDIEQTALPELFDVVTCMNALEEMKDDRIALRHMSAMTKPGGGYLILVVPHAKKYWTKKDEDALNQRRYEINELVTLCAEAGFEKVEIFTWGWPIFSWYYSFMSQVNQEKLLQSKIRVLITRLAQQIFYVIFFIDDAFVFFGRGRVLVGLFRKIA